MTISALFTAAVLGITHAFEPDHVAGITALTQENANPKLSALVGMCFGVGHSVLVVLWIAFAYLLFKTTSFPAALEQFGTVVVGVILSLLGLYLGITGMHRILHKHSHAHGSEPHAHYHLHWPLIGRSSTEKHGTHDHDHGVLAYLKIGTVGALFTLSPPVSMIAFISVAVGQGGKALMIGTVAAYTIAIGLTMALIGGGAGSLFSLSKSKGERFHAISQIVASVLVLAFAVSLLSDTVPGLLT